MTAGACLVLGAAGCAQLAPQPAPLDAARFAPIDRAIEDAVGARRMPGAVFHLGRAGMSYEKAFGRLSYDEGAAAVTPGTVFDAASLTKVVATAPLVLLLAEEGRVGLDAPLVRYLPECAGGGRDAITVRQLLAHTSGLPAGLPAAPAWHGTAKALELACSRIPGSTPGAAFRYSDVNYILLGELVRRVAGVPLDRFAAERIFRPLRMRATGFLPLASSGAARIAPTGLSPGPAPRLLQGEVHDPTARRMDGVAGSAGLFTTAHDLARYARMLLAGGELDGVRVLAPDSVRLMTTVQTPGGIAARGLGMDIDSPLARPRGTLFPVGSYGHTGFTGCILWVDPASRTFYVFLSNRVYPDGQASILDLYGRLGTLAAEAVAGFDFGAGRSAIP